MSLPSSFHTEFGDCGCTVEAVDVLLSIPRGENIAYNCPIFASDAATVPCTILIAKSD